MPQLSSNGQKVRKESQDSRLIATFVLQGSKKCTYWSFKQNKTKEKASRQRCFWGCRVTTTCSATMRFSFAFNSWHFPASYLWLNSCVCRVVITLLSLADSAQGTAQKGLWPSFLCFFSCPAYLWPAMPVTRRYFNGQVWRHRLSEAVLCIYEGCCLKLCFCLCGDGPN